MKSVGLHGIVKYVHDRTIVPVSADTITHTVSDLTVEFPIKEPWQYSRFNQQHNEHQLIKDITTSLEPDDVFYDIGAHLGWHTCFSTRVVTEGMVVAFEPHPLTVRRLRHVLKFIDEDVQVVQRALLDKNGQVEFDKNSSPAAGIVSQPNQSSITVQSVPGDDLVDAGEIPQPNVVKIDVEGAEYATISGLEQALQRSECRLVYCEIHEDDSHQGDVSKEDVIEKIEELGFSVSTFDEKLPHIVKGEK